ncbi:hypothetical protein [Streptomyces iconiensis]|uniref:Uncharacterized protein n=1 Tax=Streptomyces iconiensis TaxID=1384038 RepID=A0ABT6ZQD5_9ACTN|nr:hypothetical protein [Streptomyces iconiensis]MDJ1131270.1 hypothetical protein [Streptomyces iconiensis]
MTEQTPSQAEGEREEDAAAVPEGEGSESGQRGTVAESPRTTPSQAEGERDDADTDT